MSEKTLSEKIKYLDYEGTEHLLNTVYEDIVSYSKNAETAAKEYTDTEISDLISDAPETLNTLGKIASVISDNKNTADNEFDKKANQTDLANHMSDTSNPHGVTKAQIGLGDVDNKSSADILGEAKTYTDTAVANLIDSAPEDLDTLNELATAMKENETVVDALNAAVGNKADKTAVTAVENSLNTHKADTANPHSVTKAQVGLDKVENKSSADIRGELTKTDVTTALGFTPPESDTTYSNFVKSGSGAKAGLVPAPSTTAGTTKYLREDGTWATPPDTNTTYSSMTGATASAQGKSGLVPAPAAGAQGKYLRGDGNWTTPTNTTYSAMIGATSSADGAMGLVPKPTKGQQSYLLQGDGSWLNPSTLIAGSATLTLKQSGSIAASGTMLIDCSFIGCGILYLQASGVPEVYVYFVTCYNGGHLEWASLTGKKGSFTIERNHADKLTITNTLDPYTWNAKFYQWNL